MPKGPPLSAQLAMAAEPALVAPTRTILGVAVTDQTKAAALHGLHQALLTGTHRRIAFCNAHTANLAWSNPEFRARLAGFTVFADGVGVDLAARLLTGRAFASNLNGTDFVPALLNTAPAGLRVALIGGRPGVAVRAADALGAENPQHVFGPCLHGFAAKDEVTAFLNTLQADPVDVLLVAMGNPLQELWIEQHISSRHATLAIGVGALFDFLAGEVSRAPKSVRRARLEWAYRLLQEPRRLFRRYVLGNPLFLARVLAVKLGWATR